MKKYEIMFIVKPTLEEASIKKVFEDTKKMLTDNNATILEEKEMGQRDLAYEIKKHKTGYYYLLVLEAPVEAINEFNRIAGISQDIIRSLVTKIEK
ncbi:MAG: 30S ribosomal protein S6 [bacterium]|nr:30S ribosomal protein S6 [bacterium]